MSHREKADLLWKEILDYPSKGKDGFYAGDYKFSVLLKKFSDERKLALKDEGYSGPRFWI